MSRWSSAIAFLLFLLSHPVSGQDTIGWQPRLDSLISEGVRAQHVPGLAVGVVQDGRLVYARGYGHAVMNRADRTVTPATLFHMASVTKPFVATAIMQLVEQGKLKLDDPVERLLPYFRPADPRAARITVREMLTHTSGLPDVADYDWDKPQNDDGALERYVRSLNDRKLLWDPGTRYAYSNLAFDVLGDVIAKVSGVSFEDYVRLHILQPLGMHESTLLMDRADSTLIAAGYTRTSGGDSSIPIKAYPYNRVHGPSSDLMSSVLDMSRWAIANLNRGEMDGVRILSAASYDTLWKPAAEVEFCRPPSHVDCRKPGISVGLSWFLEQKNGHLVVSHGGGDDGFITELLLIPDRRFALVMMTNSDRAGISLLKAIQQRAIALAL